MCSTNNVQVVILYDGIVVAVIFSKYTANIAQIIRLQNDSITLSIICFIL